MQWPLLIFWHDSSQGADTEKIKFRSIIATEKVWHLILAEKDLLIIWGSSYSGIVVYFSSIKTRQKKKKRGEYLVILTEPVVNKGFII